MKIVALIGIGMGIPKNITMEGMAYIKNAEIIIGNERLLKAFGEDFKSDVRVFELNKYREITCLIENEIIDVDANIAILIAGDTGYFSEAKKIIAVLNDNPEIEIKNIPGISSLSYFFSKLNMSYDNAFSVNLNGEEGKIVQYVAAHKHVFCLGGGEVEVLLGELIKARAINTLPESLRIFIGERLSYPDEKIIYSTLKDIHKHKDDIKSMSSLAVFLFENDEAIF